LPDKIGSGMGAPRTSSCLAFCFCAILKVADKVPLLLISKFNLSPSSMLLSCSLQIYNFRDSALSSSSGGEKIALYLSILFLVHKRIILSNWVQQTHAIHSQATDQKPLPWLRRPLQIAPSPCPLYFWYTSVSYCHTGYSRLIQFTHKPHTKNPCHGLGAPCK